MQKRAYLRWLFHLFLQNNELTSSIFLLLTKVYLLFAPDKSGQALMQIGNQPGLQKKNQGETPAGAGLRRFRRASAQRLRHFVFELNYRSDRRKLLLSR